MTFEEFEKSIKALGLKLNMDDNIMSISSHTHQIALIKHKEVMEFNTMYRGFRGLPLYVRKDLMNVLVSFSSTPIKFRDGKKFYYKLPTEYSRVTTEVFNWSNWDSTYMFASKRETDSIITKFTEHDVAGLPEAVQAFMSTLVKVEVDS